jgi:hypothetical protein
MVVSRMRAPIVLTLLCSLLVGVASAQPRRGDVVGAISGGVVKCHGDYSDDMYGPVTTIGLRYLPLSRLWLEGRFSLGEYRWKVNDARIAAAPDYYGPGAQIGDLYPGTLTMIEPVNESRMTSGEFLAHYVLVPDIPASVIVSAGVGVLNSEEHSALPNNAASVYDRTVASIILGGGVHIPISHRVGLQISGEHRFVFSKWLDDVDFNGSNDGLTTFTIGLTYRFNERDNDRWVPPVDCCEGYVDNVGDLDECVSDCKCECLCACICEDCPRSPCCCCCCCGQPAASAAGTGGAAAPAPEPAAEPAPGPPAGGGPKPEKMDVPCPAGQHRECYGPPGYGICVDDEPPRGPEPIRWDLAEPLPDGSLLRSTAGKWYRKQVMPGGEVRITKGTLPFAASECKECQEKAEKR